MKLTIDQGFYAVLVRDETGHTLHSEKTNCRPYAMAHAISWAEDHGDIDWDASQYNKPAKPVVAKRSSSATRPAETQE